MLLRAHLTPESIGLAVGLGVLIGCLPIYGLHIFACVAVARWLKLNQPLMYAAANISNPVFAPFLISGQIAIGEWLRHGGPPPSRTIEEGTFWSMLSQAPDLFVSCLVGSVITGVVLGILLGAGALLAARRWPRRHDPLESEEEGAPPSDHAEA
jgi:uncharacterized protein (DUF2062 family)